MSTWGASAAAATASASVAAAHTMAMQHRICYDKRIFQKYLLKFMLLNFISSLIFHIVDLGIFITQRNELFPFPCSGKTRRSSVEYRHSTHNVSILEFGQKEDGVLRKKAFFITYLVALLKSALMCVNTCKIIYSFILYNLV